MPKDKRYLATANVRNFHVSQDVIADSQLAQVVETRVQKHLIIREREISYRFSLHQHPYLTSLAQHLIRKGVAGLQEADTKYEPNGASQPGSVEIQLAKGKPLTISAGTKVVLNEKVTVGSGGAANELEKDLKVELNGDASATCSDLTRATLVEGLSETPSPQTEFTLDAKSEAIVYGDADAKLKNGTLIVLSDGGQVTLPAGTKVRIASGSPIWLESGEKVTLLRSRRLPKLFDEFFEATYGPSSLVEHPYPVKDLDFTSSGAYAVYNWELFFHVPFTIAVHLSKNGRYAEAQKWFHYIFDPTDDSDGPTPERFWKVRPFQYTDVRKIEEILVNLATGADPALREETVSSMHAWSKAPFRPHVIARYRQQAYMYKVVMAYLDNLIAWGDSLFRQDTGEAIDEALQLYILAAKILGPKPQAVPKKGTVRSQTYANLRRDLKDFGVILRDLEPDIPFDLLPIPSGQSEPESGQMVVESIGKVGKTLYFCVPRNDKLLDYWDKVEDRLFKIHNSLNIKGVFRQLALFEPPIDPALLARAAAAGLDVGAVVNGLHQPLPLVRFAFLIQKAAEIAQEVKSLSNQLLSAMEKEDGEALALLRAKHERVVMQMVEQVKYAQLQEAIKAREGLLQSLALPVQRYTYYERQLGRKPEEIEKSIPELEELDKETLAKMRFTQKEPELDEREIEIDIAKDLGESGGKIISSHELVEFLLLEAAQRSQEEGAVLNMIAKFLSLIPEFGAQAQPAGVGAAIQFGGRALSTQLSLAADAASTDASRNTFEANKASRIGNYARREQEWAFQSNLAAGEIKQIFKQLRAAEIRQAIAEQELKSHRQQMKHAEEIEHFLNAEGAEKSGKKTNKALYAWMKREVRGLYTQCFQFAFDIARKAERALQHELGNPELTYLQFGYLAGKEGLLAGDRLHLDVKRMELAYHEQNRREYELTKNVSILQVDPLALIRLRATGRCTVRLPEELFDMDGPGHYFRRIKTVAVSIPCVTGPYASVNCKLTLLKSSIRKSPVLRDGAYAREESEDDRFSDYFGSLQSIVTSTAQNDGGLFETNLRDERYLPFENSGVISEWQLELPADPGKDEPAQFDYQSIGDVVLHVRYTAREGGSQLRDAAMKQIKDSIAVGQAAGSVRLFSIRHEFPNEWARFKGQSPGADQRYELALTFRPEHYPFLSQGRLNRVVRVDLFGQSTGDPLPSTIDVFDRADKTDAGTQSDTLAKDESLNGLFVGRLTNVPLPIQPAADLNVYFEDNHLSDLWVALTWSS